MPTINATYATKPSQKLLARVSSVPQRMSARVFIPLYSYHGTKQWFRYKQFFTDARNLIATQLSRLVQFLFR
jgi:hypothetical protein